MRQILCKKISSYSTNLKFRYADDDIAEIIATIDAPGIALISCIFTNFNYMLLQIRLRQLLKERLIPPKIGQ